MCIRDRGVRVEDPILIQKLSDILQLQLRDNVNAREMRADGSYQKVKSAPGEELVNGQMDMYDLLKDDWTRHDTEASKAVTQPQPKQPEAPAAPKAPETPQIPPKPEAKPKPAPAPEAPQPVTPAPEKPHPVAQSPAPHTESHGRQSFFERIHNWFRPRRR